MREGVVFTVVVVAAAAATTAGGACGDCGVATASPVFPAYLSIISSDLMFIIMIVACINLPPFGLRPLFFEFIMYVFNLSIFSSV